MTSDPANPYRRLARNNRLANLRLLDACLRLGAGEFEAPRIGFFPSLKATLNHILTIDWFYVDALEGGTLGPSAWAVEEPFAAPAALGAEQAKVDDRLIAFCDALTPECLAAQVSIHRQDRIQAERTENVLLHLFMHQTHHRGQAHAMLSGSSVPPPQLDEFLVRDDARFRQAELAALGWSEDDLFR